MVTNLLENIRAKYNLSPAEIARSLSVADSTVTRPLNNGRGTGTSLLLRIYSKWPDDVIQWMEENKKQ